MKYKLLFLSSALLLSTTIMASDTAETNVVKEPESAIMVNIKRYAPWNWFRDEEQSANKITVNRQTSDDPFSNFSEFQRDMERIFNSMMRSAVQFGDDFETWGASGVGMLKPKVDIAANKKAYTIKVEIPGVDEKDIKVELQNNQLLISGEKKLAQEEKSKDYYRVERSYGNFQRVLNLPQDADQERVDAHFKNGVLAITVPRIETAGVAPKKIKINS